jgi:hypothetical protein
MAGDRRNYLEGVSAGEKMAIEFGSLLRNELQSVTEQTM